MMFLQTISQIRVYLGCIVLFVAIYMLYYVLKVVKKPMLICKNPKLRNLITTHIPILSQSFWPTVWCFQGQFQTIVQGIFNSMTKMNMTYRREIITTPDGGEIALDWVDNDGRNQFRADDRPTVIILPGLSGSSKEVYVKQMVTGVVNLGFRVVVFNKRGLATQLKLKTPRLHAMANPEDTRTVVSHIKATYPLAPLIAEGFSAGAVTLFHYMEKYGEDSHLMAAMLVALLFDAFESTISLEQFPNNILFNRFLTKDLITAVIKPHESMLRQNKNIDVDSVLQAKSFRQYHARLTAPMFGYSDRRQFYRECTTNGKMHTIKVPTLILNAQDDPFNTIQSIPIEEIKQADNIALALMARGGHNGFLQGCLPNKTRFDVSVLCQFITAFFRQKDWNHFRDKKREVNCNY